MSRPPKIGLDYFPHDTDAANDEKIEALRALYGNDGYTFYFILLERIFRAENGELSLDIPSIKAALIKKVDMPPQRFDEILSTAFEVGAFDRTAFAERNVLTSRGIKRRFGQIQGQRDRWRRSKTGEIIHAENPAEKPSENAEETPERKEKKKKEKENYSPEFEKWYSSWPRAQAKADSFRNFEKIRKEKGMELIWQTTKNYLNYLGSIPEKDRGPAYASNNFFGQKSYYLDFIEPKKYTGSPNKRKYEAPM